MELIITLNRRSSVPLYRQICEELRQLILTGYLLPGERIPSTRALAKSCKVSRATVNLSYEELLSEGYLKSSHGAGTFVSDQIPKTFIQSTYPTHKLTQAKQIKLSKYGAYIANSNPFRPTEQHLPINFRYGQPAFDQLALQQWRKLLARRCEFDPNLVDYSDDLLGYRELRKAITLYLTRSRGIYCEADQVIIVNGSQQALDLVTRILCDRGDWVAMENPGCLSAYHTFLAQGSRLLPVPVDESGIVIEHLLGFSNAKIRFVYVTPSHQFSSGRVMSLSRRLELLSWAQRSGAMIIEDDYDSAYSYDNQSIPALQELDKSGTVIYIGTFSKMLFPASRIGYLVLPKNLVNIFANAKCLADRQSPLLEQQVLTDFINEGHLERHIRRMRTLQPTSTNIGSSLIDVFGPVREDSRRQSRYAADGTFAN
ncbi:PLP-dependent aminotransferase family protein [Aetokthonos hydrillicola Thurmond2011]|jgi:GntR family transcriptional regulator/MocR family aminotransferase|uniref:PLP-dependent aminotransferase family protein n=1 Tax=Aetokthonos hydrillicola Thurmond2011 TaxID=2712845 RepID=A0AAP5I529_9CYAN|nr:PLP-dependent aminotransferase family protein [Aetokthonos hydrillicola]MBO3460036.1 PLP-dependent aminotransferase family protein [Aetokthonos hydrillicola CCALA 1050]MBW4584633.1 PLP-dependent aminotransferase family protein [Aetokthonos hydrillicola CCALA 1050]MDR9895177.1 PLP-dependent aminotransferase family protein [Aetokthonos hydrillicola Thurmond2011]